MICQKYVYIAGLESSTGEWMLDCQFPKVTQIVQKWKGM